MKLKSTIDRLLARLSGVERKPVPMPPPSSLAPYDGRTPILDFGAGQVWTLKDAQEGCLVVGGTGSGKTSGPGTSLARSFLSQGCGGLVLATKPDELELWQSHCEATGRELTVFGPGSGHYFNFLEYERARPGLGAGLTTNIAELLAAIAESNQGKAGSMDAYWKNAMKQMLRRAIDVVTKAKGTLSLSLIMDVIMSAPQSLEEAESETWNSSSFLAECLREAETKRTEKNGPDLDHNRRYWLREFAALGDRTRSSIVSMISVTADGFLTGPIRELFCTGLTIVPEETHAGRVILVNLPVEEYKEVGVCAQMVWKYSWQEATARRRPENDSGIPVFLWADEAQVFASGNDMRFQATARSKRACTVYLTQNLSAFYDLVGQDRTDALFANLQTKVITANGCQKTNTWAADTIARGITSRFSTNISSGGGMNFGTSEAVDYVVPPAEFQRLRKGGPENGNLVDAYVFQAGRIWPSTGESFLKTTFRQPRLKQ